MALAWSLFLYLVGVAQAGPADPPAQTPPVPLREYRLYDLIVDSKFLTSHTDMVIIERMTTTKLGPDWPPVSAAFFAEHGFFGGRLPPDLVRDFVVSNRHPFRLEAKFNFGVRYRFVRDGVLEDPEVSLAPIPVGLVQAPPVIGTVRFSRVGFTPREDQALVYVAEERPNGTGGGFLIWLHRRGKAWQITETDVLWTAR